MKRSDAKPWHLCCDPERQLDPSDTFDVSQVKYVLVHSQLEICVIPMTEQLEQHGCEKAIAELKTMMTEQELVNVLFFRCNGLPFSSRLWAEAVFQKVFWYLDDHVKGSHDNFWQVRSPPFLNCLGTLFTPIWNYKFLILCIHRTLKVAFWCVWEFTMWKYNCVQNMYCTFFWLNSRLRYKICTLLRCCNLILYDD